MSVNVRFVSILFVFIIFFFQAEDGIRDWSVTGVQTCALPILGGCFVESVNETILISRENTNKV